MKLEAILEVGERFCVFIYRMPDENLRIVAEHNYFAISGFPTLEHVVKYCKHKYSTDTFKLLDSQGNFLEQYNDRSTLCLTQDYSTPA